MKKIAATLLFCFACAIHFGHSIVPHSHDHQPSAKDHDHHHDNEGESKSIFDLFAHFGQTGETFLSLPAQEINVSKSSATTGDYIACFHETNFSVIYKSPPGSFAEPYIFISPHLSSFLFRGPPINI